MFSVSDDEEIQRDLLRLTPHLFTIMVLQINTDDFENFYEIQDDLGRLVIFDFLIRMLKETACHVTDDDNNDIYFIDYNRDLFS